MRSVEVSVSPFALGEAGLGVGVRSDPRDSLDGVLPALAAVFRACETVMRAEAALHPPFRMRARGLTDDWPGSDFAAKRLVDEILHAQESHYCCADSSTLVAQWPGPDSPSRADLPELIVRRQVAEREKHERDMAAHVAAHPTPPRDAAIARMVTGALSSMFGPEVNARPEPPTIADIDPDAGGLGETLHVAGRGLLTLEASLSFGQGTYDNGLSWRADWPTLHRLRDELRDQVARLPGVRFEESSP